MKAEKVNKEEKSGGFVPDTYEIPTSSGPNFKMAGEGTFKIRLLSDPTRGFQYWEDKQVTRAKTIEELEKLVTVTDPKQVKPISVFVIYDYQDKAIKQWEVSQITINKKLLNIRNNEAYGTYTGQDLVIVRTGLTMNDTEYDITANPPTELSDEIQEEVAKITINGDNIFEGKLMFESK